MLKKLICAGVLLSILAFSTSSFAATNQSGNKTVSVAASSNTGATQTAMPPEPWVV